MRVFLTALVSLLMLGPSVAQQARVFGDGPITVRLCPVDCQAVNGHGYKPGAPAQILETKDGWARVSSFLPRRQLISSFGWRAVPRKPALWVALSSLKAAPTSTPTAAAPKVAPRTKTAEKPKPRRVDVVTRLARLRNPSVPSFRPGTEVATATAEPVATPEAVVVETPVEPEKPQEVAVAEPVEPTPPPAVVEPAPVVEAAPAAPAVVEPVAPAAVSSADQATSETLTWEQLQARLAAQKEQTAKSTSDADAAAARQASEAAKIEAARVAQEQEAQKAAEATRIAQQAEADRLAREAEAREVADAKARADELAAEQAREKAEADEAARQKAEAETVAKAEAEAAKAEQQRLVEQKRREAEAEAARIAAKQAAPKTAGSVGYTPPRADEAPEKPQVAATEAPIVPSPEPKVEPTQVAAVKLPPVAPTPAAPETSAEPEKPQFSGPEPTYATAEPDPMDFGSRPTKLTKKLLDKRLRKLPGRKSKMPKEVVIALRHYGLGLLNNGECTGVARGGISASPGMIFIACTDDPTYLRQFPLEEQSW